MMVRVESITSEMIDIVKLFYLKQNPGAFCEDELAIRNPKFEILTCQDCP